MSRNRRRHQNQVPLRALSPGLLLAAILCRSHGIHCQYLGPNLPADALEKAAKTLRPQWVVLALARLSPADEKITPRDYLARIDQSLAKNVELWIGGAAAHGISKSGRKHSVFAFDSLWDLESKLRALSAP